MIRHSHLATHPHTTVMDSCPMIQACISQMLRLCSFGKGKLVESHASKTEGNRIVCSFLGLLVSVKKMSGQGLGWIEIMWLMFLFADVVIADNNL